MNYKFLYIMYNFGGIRSNLRVYAVNNSTFFGDTAKIGISRKISQKTWTYLDLLTDLEGVLLEMIFQIFS